MSTLFYVSYVALWVLLLTMGVLVLLLYRHFGVMSLGTLEGVQRDGLPIGSVAPPISGVTAAGQDTRWEPKRGQPQLLLFAAPDCEPCATVLPHVDGLARAVNGGLGIVTVVPGPRDEVARFVERYHPRFPCLAEDGSGAFTRYRVRVTPFGFILGTDGRVLAKGLCGDQVRLRGLLEAADLRDIAQALPIPAQPVKITPLNPAPTGRSSAVSAARNGVDRNER
jgi:methylamine dehydrogenase accessory protein MauD